jgi:hypothetical protein
LKRLNDNDAARYLSGVFGSITAAITSLARGFKSEFCEAAAAVQYNGRTRWATGAETASMANFVGMTGAMLKRQNTWFQGNGWGSNVIALATETREFAKEQILRVRMDFFMHELVDTKKKDEKPIMCPVTRCMSAADVLEGSCERHKFLPIGGKFRGKLAYKCGCDRGGDFTRFGGINCCHTGANSCKEYDNMACFGNAPDNFDNVSSVMFQPLEPQLVELDKGNMLIVGDVYSDGERRAKAVPRECRLGKNALSKTRRFVVDEERVDQPFAPTSSDAEWVLCTSEEGRAVGVGHKGPDGLLAGFYKFHEPMLLKDDAVVLTVEVEIFFVFDIAEISNVLGHQGCSSSHPCPLCDLHKDNFKTCFDDLKVKPKRRTSEAMYDCKRRFDAAGGHKADAKNFLNVTEFPMLSEYWDLEKKLVPPQVHAVTIGIGNTIYSSFLSLVRVDEKTTGNEKAREAMEAVKSGLKANSSGLLHQKKEHTRLVNDVKSEKEQCYDLLTPKGFSKTAITRGVTEAELQNSKVEDATIRAYLAKSHILKGLILREKTTKEDMKQLRKDIDLQQKACEEYEETVFVVGPIEEAIETTWLKSVGVSHSTYHKCEFVGNGVKSIIEKKSRESLWTFLRTEYVKAGKDIAAAEELIKKVKPLFDGFAELLHLTCAVRLLTATEKAAALSLCKSVPRMLRGIKPNSQIKTHMIEFELHQFIEYWGTLGILNEEAFESIHAHMNNLLRRFACVRDRNLRDRLMHTAFCVLQATKADTDKMILAGKRKMKKQRPNPDLAALG